MIGMMISRCGGAMFACQRTVADNAHSAAYFATKHSHAKRKDVRNTDTKQSDHRMSRLSHEYHARMSSN